MPTPPGPNSVRMRPLSSSRPASSRSRSRPTSAVVSIGSDVATGRRRAARRSGTSGGTHARSVALLEDRGFQRRAARPTARARGRRAAWPRNCCATRSASAWRPERYRASIDWRANCSRNGWSRAAPRPRPPPRGDGRRAAGRRCGPRSRPAAAPPAAPPRAGSTRSRRTRRRRRPATRRARRRAGRGRRRDRGASRSRPSASPSLEAAGVDRGVGRPRARSRAPGSPAWRRRRRARRTGAAATRSSAGWRRRSRAARPTAPRPAGRSTPPSSGRRAGPRGDAAASRPRGAGARCRRRFPPTRGRESPRQQSARRPCKVLDQRRARRQRVPQAPGRTLGMVRKHRTDPSQGGPHAVRRTSS